METTATSSEGFPRFRVFFRALLRLFEQPIKVISLYIWLIIILSFFVQHFGELWLF